MVSREELFRECSEILAKSGVEFAEFDAECIFQDVLGEKNFRRSGNKQVSEREEAEIRSRIKRRGEGYPLQYISGEWEFMGLPFKVGEGVLIPRQDTETLAEFAMKLAAGKKELKLCDLCSGSGCLGISLEKKLGCETYCVELHERAFSYLQENIRLNGSGAKAVRGDVCSKETAELLPEFDIIVCNPPYLTKKDMEELDETVRFEPETALFGGEDGLDFYRSITRIWKGKLKPRGTLIFEIGEKMAEEVSEIMIRHGFVNVRCRKDLAGKDRVVFGEMPGQLYGLLDR